jgi:hypothetical protein
MGALLAVTPLGHIIVWNYQAETNTLAYYSKVEITAKVVEFHFRFQLEWFSIINNLII